MGRILLAGLQAAELDAYLDRVAIVPFTEFTLRTTPELRAAIERARRHGWCLVDRERDLGVISLAVPLNGRSGKVIAALNVSLHAGSLSADEVRQRFLPELLRAQQRINDGLRVRS
jgi:IclR family pca regulon transcriptional regulator